MACQGVAGHFTVSSNGKGNRVGTDTCLILPLLVVGAHGDLYTATERTQEGQDNAKQKT
jgi:hypothetical protein